jgi:uncharacterized membrane protein
VVGTDVLVETVIARPREEVAAYVMDWRNDPTWIRALEDVRLEPSGEVGVGTRVTRVASFLGRRLEYVNEVVEHEPGRRLLMRSVKAPFPMTVTYEFEDAGARDARVRIRAQGDASGYYRLAAPLLAAAVRRSIAGDLRRLKKILEAAP